jgi:hypothetical protein
MNTYVIDDGNNATVYGPGEALPETVGPAIIKTSDELAKLAEGWPASRLVEIWNTLPGNSPIKRFTDRKTAVNRIWKAIQRLKPTVPAETAQGAFENAGATKDATPAAKGARAKKTQGPGKSAGKPKTKSSVRDGSKTAKVLDLLKRPTGATLKELMKATGWQPHSVRGFLSGAVGRKLGLTVESTKRDDGDRVYSIGR